jgi:hypothetical protein
MSRYRPDGDECCLGLASIMGVGYYGLIKLHQLQDTPEL